MARYNSPLGKRSLFYKEDEDQEPTADFQSPLKDSLFDRPSAFRQEWEAEKAKVKNIRIQDKVASRNAMYLTKKKGGGKGGRDLYTINIRGVFIDLSWYNLNMTRILYLAKITSERYFRGENVLLEGSRADINLKFNFKIAKSYKEVKEDDILFVFTGFLVDGTSAVTNPWTRTIFMNDAYFTSWAPSWNIYIYGPSGIRSLIHELGHLFGTEGHPGDGKLMKQGVGASFIPSHDELQNFYRYIKQAPPVKTNIGGKPNIYLRNNVTTGDSIQNFRLKQVVHTIFTHPWVKVDEDNYYRQLKKFLK